MTDRGDPGLRPATDADAGTIARLLTAEGYPAGPSDIIERLAAFRDDRSAVLVATASGEVVGFVAVHVMSTVRAW